MHALSRAFLFAVLTLACAADLAAGLAAGATAQGGYRKATFDDLGMEIPVPRNYKAVPVEPTEKWVALKWVDEKTNAKNVPLLGKRIDKKERRYRCLTDEDQATLTTVGWQCIDEEEPGAEMMARGGKKKTKKNAKCAAQALSD